MDREAEGRIAYSVVIYLNAGIITFMLDCIDVLVHISTFPQLRAREFQLRRNIILSEFLAKLYCHFTPATNDCAEQGMRRCSLGMVVHCSIEVSKFIVSELPNDLGQEW